MKKFKRFLLSLACVALAFVMAACGNKAVTETAALDQHNWDDGVVTKQPTCGTAGERVYTCRDCGETRTEVIEPTGQHMFTGTAYLVKEPTATEDGELCRYCTKCKQFAKSGTITLSQYQSQTNGLITNIAGFSNGAFGQAYHTKLSTKHYAQPTAITTGHPRLLFTASDLPAIRAAVADVSNSANLRTLFSTAAAYDNAELGEVTFHASADNTGPYGTHNCNEAILRTIIAKAFLYQVTGAKLYGYQAILMAKQYITTLEIESVSNEERYYGYTMFMAAIVYDWCYDLLTSTDQKQLMYGVEALCRKGMEIGFPPESQGAVCDHGCERQLLRDYLSFAIAIYNEDPTWYQFIGGRVYQDYVPVRDAFYESGYTPQGLSTYLPIRFGSDMWSAWILKAATGRDAYNAEDMKQVLHSVFSRIVDGQYAYMPEGDDGHSSNQNILTQLTLSTWISASLYDDATAAAWAKFLGGIDAPYYFILKPNLPEPDGNRYDGLDLILYNGGYLGEIVAHDGWLADSCTVKMKIGNYTTSGHDHAESGSFQIYYKGLLAGDSGYYDTYGSTHYWNYHRSSIAHNTIAVGRRNNDGSYTTIVQRSPGTAPKTYNEWWNDANDKYHKGDTVGVAYGYADAEQTVPVFAYIAGNITAAYESGVASEVTRRMLAVYDTGNENVPMYLFVFDHVTTANATDRVTFLLHTLNQPTVSGNTVTAYAGEGAIVLQSVIGGDVIEKIGGAGRNYWLNGEQIATRDGEEDGYWGRVEISADSAGKTETMLNVIYVTDADKQNSVSLPATAIETEKVSGSVIGSTAAVFVNSAARASGTLTFTADGSGTLHYYVSGVSAGNWTVQVGSTTQTVTATQEGGLLTFSAPAGTVTLTSAGR